MPHKPKVIFLPAVHSQALCSGNTAQLLHICVSLSPSISSFPTACQYLGDKIFVLVFLPGAQQSAWLAGIQ